MPSDEVGEGGRRRRPPPRSRAGDASWPPASRAASPQTRQGRALAPLVAHVRPDARALRGAHRRRRDGSRAAPVRDVRRPLSVLHPRRLGRRPRSASTSSATREPSSRQYAIDLGVALQLTNILRDVRGDLEQGRVYIPQEDLRATAAPKTICARSRSSAGGGVRSPAVKALLRHQALRARDYYARAARALPRRDARRLVAAEIMAAIYRGVLDGIERRDYDVFSEVVRIPRPRRAVIAAVDVDSNPARTGRRARPASPATMTPDVVVVGAGFAGLSAAAATGRRGPARAGLEARPQLGGRATAFPDRVTGELVDNGQHVLFGCYTQTFAFLKRIGAEGNVRRQAALQRAVSGSVGQPFGAGVSGAAAAAAPAWRRAEVGRDVVAAIGCRSCGWRRRCSAARRALARTGRVDDRRRPDGVANGCASAGRPRS